MKICPQCETGYHDSHTTCPTHGGMLSEIRDLRPGMLIRDTYRIKKKLGKGGMGAVYLAQHTLLDEPRALKFLSQDLSEDENFTTRFLREVRTLRSVRNKNVVDCGDPERAEDGSLFFSMEYVEGPNLRDYLKTAPKPLDVKLALEIARGIANGLGAAHAKGMVHRDIKPENILMASDGPTLIPKIADFGIVATKESSQQTRTGSTLLTMAYAAPEQWTGTRAADLDGRTDLYALGGVLFEMLTGHTVFDAENYHGWAQKHLNATPPAPSTFRPELVRWKGLDAFVLRLLAKERSHRPQNVAEFLTQLFAITYDPTIEIPEPASPDAATVMHVPQNGSSSRPSYNPPPSAARLEAETSLPLPAHRASMGFNPPAAETSMPVPVQRPGTSASSTPGFTRSAAPPEAISFTSTPPPPTEDGTTFVPTTPVAGIQQTTPTSVRPPGQTGVRTPAQTGATSDGTLGSASRRVPDSRTSGSQQTVTRTAGGTVIKRSESAQAVKKGVPAWVWVALLAVIAGGAFAAQRFYKPKPKFAALQSQNGPILSLAFAPNGITLASASRDRTIQLWDISTMKALNTLSDTANAVAFSPDGHYMASADADNNLRLWDATTGQLAATLGGHTDQAISVAFSPDGRLLASGSRDTTIKLWDVAGDRIVRTLSGHAGDVNAVAFSPDARTLASASADTSIRLWDPSSGKLLGTLQGHTRPVNAIAFSSDRKTLASGSDDTTVKLWDVSAGKETHTLQGHTDAVHAVAFSADGRNLASGSSDYSIRLWDASTGQPAGVLQGNSAAVLAVAFGQGNVLASGSEDRSIKLWDLTTVR